MVSRFVQVVVLTAFVISAISFASAQTFNKSIVIKDGKKQGWLGVELQDVTRRLKDKKDLSVSEGAYISNVIENSPAEEAGIKEGDVITKFDGNTIEDSDDLTKAVRKTKPKTEVKIEVARRSDHKTLTATIGRLKTPQAFSFNFDTPETPRSPMKWRSLTTNEMYGLELQSLNKQLGEYFEAPGGRGVLVAEVEKGSKAEKAGFKAGDVITKVNKNTIRDIDDLYEEFSDMEGKDVPCDVLRKGKTVTLSLHIEEEDDEDDDDYSYNMMVPHGHPEARMYHMTFPRIDRESIDRMKEELREFKGKLKEKMQELKETLRRELKRS